MSTCKEIKQKEPRSQFVPYTIFNSKWIIDLHVNVIKCLEEKRGRGNLYIFGISKELLDKA